MELRQYQKDILNKLWRSLKENNKILVQAPTGAGKTVMLSTYIEHVLLVRNKRVLIVVDKLEILQQFGETMMKCNIPFGILHGDSNGIHERILLSTIQTLYRRELDFEFEYIFFDEIHNYYDKLMYNKLVEQFPNAKIIGFTATPITNKGYLLPGFDAYINDLQIIDLIKQGYLCDCETYVNNDFDLDTKLLRLSQGEYMIDDVNRYTVTEHNLRVVFNEHNRLAWGKKTIYFCSSVKQAEAYAQFFKRNGVDCKVISSNSYYHERVRAIRDFKEGELRVIFNVNILTTGFDEPSVEVVGLLNPTKILRKYIQCCGRGLRIAPNKDKCLILDFVQNYDMHGDIRDIRLYKKAEVKVKYKDCPECGLIVESHLTECPQCGYKFTVEVEGSSGKSYVTPLEMKSLEKAFNYQQELIKQLNEQIKLNNFKPGYLFFLLKDILEKKPQQQSTVNYYRSKLAQMEQIRQKGYKLNYIRYNHGKYEDVGVSDSNDIPPVVPQAAFYNALMARTQRGPINR